MAASSVGGGVQEQTGEKLDRLGLLHTRQASKPRTAEPTIVIVQNNLLFTNQRSDKARTRHEGERG